MKKPPRHRAALIVLQRRQIGNQKSKNTSRKSKMTTSRFARTFKLAASARTMWLSSCAKHRDESGLVGQNIKQGTADDDGKREV
jgi:hypothetical protein